MISRIRLMLALSMLTLGNCLHVEVLIKVTTTLEKVMTNTKSETTGMNGIVNNVLDSTLTKCMKVCRGGGSTCYDCGLDGPYEQIDTEFVIRFFGSTDKTAADFLSMAESSETQLATIFDTVSPTRINIAPAPSKVLTMVTVTETIANVRTKTNELVTFTKEAFAVPSLCSLICNFKDPQGGCFSCSQPSNSEPAEKAEYTVRLHGEYWYDKEDVSTIENDMLQKVKLLFGEDNFVHFTVQLYDSVKETLSPTAITATPATDVPGVVTLPVGEKTVVVKYSITLDFNVLVKNMLLLTTATQQSLGGTGVGKCVNICSQIADDIEQTSECFSCSGTTIPKRSALIQSTKWVVTVTGTAVVTKDKFVADLDRVISAVVENLGGSLHTVTASSTFSNVVIDSNDDSLSGGAIAAIVVGSIAALVILVLVLYCFVCSAKDTPANEENEMQKSPDSV
eukprot:TRINITY_DN26_c1_g1_i1.p2 TRINITY_DN26_c1_g1~~TRINITY_DN26_c1_g1_i1.p2  ORF type:complete len:452 (+),score=84.77 TRINITY_DN26_c1_g1_i1:2079-3434(+)